MLRCVAYALFFGLASGLVLWLLAEPVGFLCIGDARTVRSLRISALGMPCISLCAAFSGYFTACGRVWKPTFIHFAEQLAGIALVAYFLRAVPDGEIEQSCAARDLRAAAGGRSVHCSDADILPCRPAQLLRRGDEQFSPDRTHAKDRAAARGLGLCAQRPEHDAASARPARTARPRASPPTAPLRATESFREWCCRYSAFRPA